MARPTARGVFKWIGIVLASLVALVAAIVFGLDTSPGRRFLVDRLAGFETASGLNFRVGRIDGSIYGRMVLTGVQVRDPQGAFLTAPRLVVDWRPFAYIHSKIDVRDFAADSMQLLRKPALKPTPSDPNAPLLPDIDLRIGRLAIGRFDIAAPVTGQRHVVRLAGTAAIADGRAQISADGDALKAAGIAGGDHLALKLDAVPADNKFLLDARLTAPARGLIDSYAGFGKPLTLTIAGNGDWKAWRGTTRGTLGGQPIADLAVVGQNGTFHTTGFVRPGLVLTGPASRMTEPAIRLDLVTAFANRTIDTRLTASSDAFLAGANGLVDLANSSFRNFRVEATLLTPGAILPNVRGRDVKLAAALDGAFARPTVDYKLSATTLAFDATAVQGLYAEGRARIDADRILVPVHARARAVTGLNAAVGGLLTNLRVDGDIAYQNGKVASDNLALRTDRIDATALILADLTTGKYTGALKGRINDYQVAGLGRINLVTDAHLVTPRGGGFGIAGTVKVLTRRLDNASLRDQLGGNAVVTADVGYDLAGGGTVRNLRMVAPRFRITGGEGSYRPDGRLAFRAQGSSRQYGPFSLTAGGTIERPVATLRAAHPNVGVQLNDVVATLEGTAAGYHVRARGGSPYGPFDADVLVRAGSGPLAVDIASATFAGIRFAGRVVQTAAGPFAGRLMLAGSGLNGSVVLASQAGVQRADLDVRAQSARIPAPTPITIGSGTVQATVLLPAAGPTVAGQFALADVRQDTLLVSRAQGRIAYRNGAGTVALVAAGENGAPFRIAAQAQLSPTRVVANLKGVVNGIPMRLARPAVATKVGSNWTLAPATLVLPQGQADVSGSYGATTALHAVLRSLDLSIADSFAPGLGLGGKASGIVDYSARGTVPNLRARVDVAGFTRTASLTVSDPVDIAVLATLGDAGADVRALIRRNGATLGRFVTRLAPLGGGGSLMERLAAAPLSGGIRYNGPAEVLWALGGIADQQLSGPIAIGADFGGRILELKVGGVVRANALRYENTTFGTVLSQMAIDGRFTSSEFQLNSLTAKAGNGTIAASGKVGIDAEAGYPIDVRATMTNAQLARSDSLGATVTGTIAVTNSREAGGLIKGDIAIPEARYQIAMQGAAAVSDLAGVRRKGAPPAKPAPPSPVPSNWKLDLHLHADNRIFVQGMGLEAEWMTDMRVGGTTAAPNVTGKLEVIRGTYSFNGRRFDLDHGVVTFQGAQFTNPALDILATTTVTGVTANIAITGTAQAPQIAFTSTPALPQDEVLSLLLFGGPVTSLSPTQAIQLASALNSLRGSGGGGLNPLGKLRGATGIDRLRVLGADKTAGRGTALAAGQYISNNVYVEIITDARGFTATQLEVSLSRALSVLSQTGSFGGSNVTVRYKKNY